MKQLYRLTLFLLFVGLSLISKNNYACIDYATAIYVSGHYDGAEWDDYIVTVHNLELFGGPSGAFCTCAISNWTGVFDQITYIAFVDSGTYNPISEFEPWEYGQNTSDGWMDEVPWLDWDGFLAQTVGVMTSGTPVELIIRGTLPPPTPQIPFGNVDSLINAIAFNTVIGTDEWSESGDSLANSHYQLLYPGWPELSDKSQAFFDSVDQQITGINNLDSPNLLRVYPNPVTTVANITMSNKGAQNGTIDLFNSFGQAVLRRSFKGVDKIVRLDLEHLPSGIYFVSIVSEGSKSTKKLIKL